MQELTAKNLEGFRKRIDDERPLRVLGPENGDFLHSRTIPVIEPIPGRADFTVRPAASFAVSNSSRSFAESFLPIVSIRPRGKRVPRPTRLLIGGQSASRTSWEGQSRIEGLQESKRIS